MRFGFEKEFFVQKKGKVILPPHNMAKDGGGILAEARGLPDDIPALAFARLEHAVKQLQKTAKESQVKLICRNSVICDAKLLHMAVKHKNLSSDIERFAYPTELRLNKPGEHRAGLHIHFSDTHENLKVGKGSREHYAYKDTQHRIFDMFLWIKVLDREFEREILQAGRYKGAYKMKPYGFEYRSLPATVSLDKVVSVLEQILEGKMF